LPFFQCSNVIFRDLSWQFERIKKNLI